MLKTIVASLVVAASLTSVTTIAKADMHDRMMMRRHAMMERQHMQEMRRHRMMKMKMMHHHDM